LWTLLNRDGDLNELDKNVKARLSAAARAVEKIKNGYLLTCLHRRLSLRQLQKNGVGGALTFFITSENGSTLILLDISINYYHI